MNPVTEEDWSGERIGILGGSFDPPHTAHVCMATLARQTLHLDRVFFSPAPHPPHKSDASLTSWEHRRAMTRAAVEDCEGLAVTDMERDARPSYTADLLRAVSARTAADLYFIAGADSLAGFASWHEPEEILRLCTLVVFPRAGDPVRLPVPGMAGVVVLDAPPMDVSSSGLREALAAGTAGEGLLAPSVVAYIRQHRLYGSA
jgi:nicotinate-nucleotide adenylyltransferase